MKPKLIYTFVLSFMACVAVAKQNKLNAQVQVSTSFFDDVRFGGSVGASFGSDYVSVNLAPKAIYDFNKYFSVGTGLLGAYAKSNYSKATVLGGSAIALFRPLNALQLSVEFQELHVSRKYENGNTFLKDNYWYPSLFLGAGYSLGNVTVGLRYDVLYDNRSVYANAWVPFISFYF